MKNPRLRISERIISLILSIVVLAGCMPFTAFAASEESGSDTSQSETTDPSTDDGSSTEGDGTEGSETPATIDGYVLMVQDSNQNAIEGATVEYSFTVDNTADTYTGTATTDSAGKAGLVIDESYECVNSKVYYTVTADGYTSSSGEQVLSAWGESGTIQLTAEVTEVPEQNNSTVSATVSGSGTGTVTLSGNDIVNNPREFGIGSTVDLVITANTASYSYIKSVTINGQAQTIGENETQSKTINLTLSEETYEIAVEFVVLYEVVLKATEGGTLTVNDNTASFTVEKDTALSISAIADGELKVDYGRYILSRMSINNVEQTFEESGCEMEYVASSENALDGKIVINVEFSLIYIVEVVYKSGGTVSTYPEFTIEQDEYGYVTLVRDKQLTLTATPDENHRVLNVVINEVAQEIKEENDSSYTTTLAANTDYTILITFAKNQYKVALEEENGFTIKAVDVATSEEYTDLSKIPYGSEVNVEIIPPTDYFTTYKGYKVTCDGVSVGEGKWTESGSFKYTINSVAEDYTFGIINGYELSISTDFENATVTVNGDEVTAGESGKYSAIFEEGSSVSVKVEADDGYYIKSDDDTYGGTTYSDTLEIGGDVNITVEISANEVADLDGYPFNESDALRVDGNTYVFANGATVTFTVPEGFEKLALGTELKDDGIYYKDFVDSDTLKSDIIKSDTTIYGIKLLKRDDDGNIEISEVSGISQSSPLKIVFDTVKPNAGIEITTEPFNIHGWTFYSGDIEFEYSASDAAVSSGLSKIEYCIEYTTWSFQSATTEWITLDTFSSYEDMYSDKNSFTIGGDGILSAADWDKVKTLTPKIRVTDAAGNSITTSSSEQVEVNTVPPEITVDITQDASVTVSYSNYYNGKRTATVKVVDRTFVKSAFEDCIEITAVDASGTTVVNPYSTSWSESGYTHTLTISFNADANYTWDISELKKYNSSGTGDNEITDSNENIVASSVIFTIDTTSPTGEISIKDNEEAWEELFNSLTFNIFKKTELTFTAKGTDVTSSPEPSVLYYEWDESVSAIPTDKTELIAALNACTFDEDPDGNEKEGVTVSADKKFVVFAKITDCAGNYKYISTNGIVVDRENEKNSTITITPSGEGKGGYFTSDVEVDVLITDDFSGVASARYEVWANNQKTQYDDLTLGYTNDSKKEASANFTVYSDENNADYVIVKIFVTDRAGNGFEKSRYLDINKTKPTAAIEFVDTYEDSAEVGYFKSRKAIITVTDRARCFDSNKVAIGISMSNNDNSELLNNSVKADDGSVTGQYYNISKWTSNGDVHTAEIEFLGNAKYEWSFGYTNIAGLPLENINLSSAEQKLSDDKLCPYEFTVDNDNPSASLKIQEPAWDELIETLTFGIFSKKELAVYTTASDVTSPIIVSYYKYNGTEKLTAEALDSAANTDAFKEYKKGVTSIDDYAEMLKISGSERFTIYLRVADYAGNYIYISSDGHIIDMVKPDVQIGIDAPKGNGVYNIANGNVKVTPTVTDPEISSGIKTITYTVEKLDDSDNDNVIECTQSGTLYEYTVPSDVQYDDLVKSINNKSFNVDPSLNNWSRVRITVKATDNAGNVGSDTVEIDIDATAPSIDVTYDNNNSTNSYFNADRTATVVITERNDHFSSSDATKGIVIQAVDISGQKVDGTYTLSNWTTSVNSADPDATTHTATIKYSGDANYTFAISYTDKAGNANSAVDTGTSVSPYDFTVDKTAPKASVSAASAEGRTEKWEGLVTSLNFGFWSKEKIAITSESSDATSPIASVSYYKASSKNSADFSKVMTVSELNNLASWTSFNSFNIVPNEQAVVYIKIADMAGNITYVCTNGLIVDNTSPIEEVQAPQITVTPQGAASGIYNGDVSVSISVEDPLAGGTYSGLKTVSYRVLNMGEVTQSGTLYTFNNANPAGSQLLSSWNGQITVDSSLNNSNDVVIEVYGEDNALNSSTNSISIKIDTTAPAISVSYNNNSAVDDYFNEDRVATVVVTERNFNEDEVIVTITNTDGEIPSIGAWTMSTGSGNGDDTRWSAPITYSADGDYTFDISCTDMAGNVGGEPTFASGTVAPTEFTIDLTDPVITVSYDSQSDNGYYDDTRTATITINEHNFNADDVNITIAATDDSVAIDAPSVSQWSTRGDVHTATIVYSDDAKYTFSIAYTDDAGNEAQGIENEVFYVDKTAPELSISGVENQSANSGEVAPIIEFADTNIDFDSVVITLSGANRGDDLELIGDYSEIHNGQIFNFENFAETEENDDIYTLSVSLSDYAGNTSEATITFSVNRFGSTYALSEGTQNLIGSYVTDPEDIVITEVNANELSEITVTLFKNNSTLELVEGEDYSVSVEGGDGQWYKYTYTIFAENFTDDGVYRINVHSKDKAGNVAENTLDTKATEISFGVDKTPPNVVVANTESFETYAKESHTVLMNIDDNLKLASVTVYLDGEEYAVWTGEELEAIVAENGEFSFEVSGDSTKAHNVEIVSLDSAGNETVVEIEDFYVTTNLLVRYYNNKPLFFGSIFGIIALIAFIIFLIVYKRRKREQVRF